MQQFCWIAACQTRIMGLVDMSDGSRGEHVGSVGYFLYVFRDDLGTLYMITCEHAIVMRMLGSMIYLKPPYCTGYKQQTQTCFAFGCFARTCAHTHTHTHSAVHA